LQQRWSSEFHPHGELPSNSDERGHRRLGNKNAATEMKNLGLKVSTAHREMHEWVQAFRLRRGETRGAFRCHGWLTERGKLAGRIALERRRPGSGRELKTLTRVVAESRAFARQAGE